VPHHWLHQGKYGGTMNWVAQDASDWGTTHLVQESLYGNSPLRLLKDSLEIGPGLAESWETNADQSTWTFHFRKGLKWSDGQPWTVADILFWWEDEVHVPELNEVPPTTFAPARIRLPNSSRSTITRYRSSLMPPLPCSIHERRCG
jgi:peptide/nickel transport system substrate-binding protein